MKTMARRRSWSAVVALLIKRALRSERVATVIFQASFLFFIMAVTGGQWGAILAGMALTAAAGKHLENVERNK